MSFSTSRLLAPLAAVYVAFGLFFGILVREAHAEPAAAMPAATITPSISTQTLGELKAQLDQTDRLAVLEAIHVGLTDAPDGSTYMWRRHNGKIILLRRFNLFLGRHAHRLDGR